MKDHVKTLLSKAGVKRSIPSSFSSKNYKFQKHNTSSQGRVITGPSKLPDRGTALHCRSVEWKLVDVITGPVEDQRDNEKTQRTSGETSRSNQTNTKETLPYYLRSRIQEKTVPEEISNIEIQRHTWQHIPQKKPQWKSTLNGDQCIGFNRQNPGCIVHLSSQCEQMKILQLKQVTGGL
ncbi:hypothetical protein TNCV_1398251 [Trichonephila clavipes]|nr:hypothetical protein TNCV_1398251 [Trichonephila clavipes]